MYSKWLLSERSTKFLMAGTLIIFLATEALIIVALFGLRNERPLLGLGHLLPIVFILALSVSVPTSASSG
jgi:hypothetical protein